MSSAVTTRSAVDAKGRLPQQGLMHMVSPILTPGF
jgi:hypothetical protein